MLADVVNRIAAFPLTSGNHVQPLVNGDEAFPAMLAAIESAQKSISLSTYIFDNDLTGEQFAAALSRAVARGWPCVSWLIPPARVIRGRP